ncbi:hypothetical protein GCM10029992_50370 [Glycomyces albus]
MVREPNEVPYQGPERTLTSAQWVAERGLGLGIDFHYADSWADPGKQPKPEAWAELEFDDLTDAVYDYTYDYVSQLVDQGTVPDKVAVGNEIANGFMWGSEALDAPATEAVHAGANPPYFRDNPEVYQSQPGGGILWQYRDSEDPDEYQLYLDSWDRFTTLLASGIAAVRDASPETEVELHSVVGRISGMDKAGEFWDQLVTRVNAKGQDFDVLGLSYYPEWHGTPEQMEFNLHTLATTYPQYELEIAETSYPATGGGTQPNSPSRAPCRVRRTPSSTCSRWSTTFPATEGPGPSPGSRRASRRCSVPCRACPASLSRTPRSTCTTRAAPNTSSRTPSTPRYGSGRPRCCRTRCGC